MAIIAALISVAGVFGGIYFAFRQFKKQQKTNRDQVYWAKQFDAYKEACDAAGAIASAATIDDVAAEREAFKRLYWGVMCVIEHTNVELKMNAFYEQLKRCEERLAKPSSLTKCAYDLAHECRESLQTTWRPDNIGTLTKDRNIKIDAPNLEVRMNYKVVINESEEGFSVSCPGLPGCWSQGATEEEALENIQDAIAEYLGAIDELVKGQDVREVRVAV